MSTETPLAALAPTRTRQKVSKNKSKNTKWTAEEDDYFTQLMANHPNQNWSDLLPYFPGKTAQQISERWEKVLNPALVKGSWTRDEDERIIEFVHQYGVKNWTKLASILPGRIGKQCRERWRNHLDPDINKHPWTAEEDAKLIELHEKLGNSWVKIAEQIPGRSDNSVKNRWNSTLKKRLEYSKPGTPHPKRGRPSLSTPKSAESLPKPPTIPKSADDVPKPPKFDEITPIIKATSPSVAFTPGLISPFLSLKSPFTGMSPMIGNQIPGFSCWSPARDPKDFEAIGAFSPQLMSPSNSENRSDVLNLLSPLFKK